MANGRHSRGLRAGEERRRLRYLSTGFLSDKLQRGSGLFSLSSSSSSLALLLQPGLIIAFLDASLVGYLYLTTNPQSAQRKNENVEVFMYADKRRKALTGTITADL